MSFWPTKTPVARVKIDMSSVPQTVTTRLGTTASANEVTVIPQGYKQTEVGVIPEDWEVKPLAGLAAILHGFGFQSEYFTTFGKYRLATPGHFHEAGGFRDVGDKQKFYDGPLPDGYLLREGDLIVAMTEQADGLLGSAALVPSSGSYLHNQRLGKIRMLSPDLSTRFLYRIFNSPLYRAKVRETAAGTKVKHTSPTKLLEITVPLPPTKAEQEAIAEALSDADKLLEALEKLIAKKRAIKQAAMQQLLTGKTRLPDFSGEWQNHQVQNVIRWYFCGPSPTCDERNIESDDEWGVLKTTAATVENGWDWRQHKALPHAYWGREHQKVESGDVIITKAGPRHRVGVAAWVDYVPDRIIVSGKMIGLRPDTRKATPFMLAAALRARETQIYLDLRTTGMAESQVNFENEDLLEAPILLPPIAEQRAIATVFSDLDAEIAALERRLDKTHAIKQGIMQQLLTGRVRLVSAREGNDHAP